MSFSNPDDEGDGEQGVLPREPTPVWIHEDGSGGPPSPVRLGKEASAFWGPIIAHEAAEKRRKQALRDALREKHERMWREGPVSVVGMYVQLDMLARAMAGDTTLRASPEETHANVPYATAWLDGAQTELLASFHGNTFRAKLHVSHRRAACELTIGPCWNAEECGALIRLLRLLAHCGAETVRMRVKVDIPAVPADRASAKAPRVDWVEAVAMALSFHFPWSRAVTVEQGTHIAIQFSDPGERDRVMQIERAKLFATHKAVTVDELIAIDTALERHLKIFKFYSSPMARHVATMSAFTYVDGVAINEAELERYNEFQAGSRHDYHLVGLDPYHNAVVSIRVRPDSDGGHPLVRPDDAPYMPPEQKFDRDPSDPITGDAVHVAWSIGQDQAMYGFQTFWPDRADGIVRRVRYSVEIEAFYEHTPKTNVARRILGILLAHALPVVQRANPDVAPHDLVAVVYAAGQGVRTAHPRRDATERSGGPSLVDARDRTYGVAPPSQLGLRGMYTNFGLAPVAAAGPDGSADSASSVRKHIRDVYTTRYLNLDPVMSVDERNSHSVHAGSLLFLMQAVAVRYRGVPPDPARYKIVNDHAQPYSLFRIPGASDLVYEGVIYREGVEPEPFNPDGNPDHEDFQSYSVDFSWSPPLALPSSP